MPIYIYRCRECGEKFESFRSIHDNDAEVTCPKCGKKNPERLFAPVFGQISRGGSGNQRFPT
ncbi:MAG: zinc ribbon domain-containing protein [Dehalococcoidales bacterium]|nr:zinc ribbon domain-containing protein [Dehalococcoidales bacterium]